MPTPSRCESLAVITSRRADGTTAWRLPILEDAGELPAADPRAVTGQALSRLLNVTDGLLGEGCARWSW